MSASKDKERGTWIVYIRYKDWKGEDQVHKKRGFRTKREALEYEREFLLKKSKDMNMSFTDFVNVYMEDKKPRIRYNTMRSKPFIERCSRSQVDTLIFRSSPMSSARTAAISYEIESTSSSLIVVSGSITRLMLNTIG